MSIVAATSLPPEFLSALRVIFPPDRLLAEEAHLAAYESDGLTAFAVTPRAVVMTVSPDEVIETVRACAKYQVPFVARGSGTSLSGGSVPVDNGIVIALNRLTKILRLDPVQRIAVVEPGVVNVQVTKAAAQYGLIYAPDPSSQQICTIGGNVAFNAGGAHCLKYGMTSNHVIGMKCVLATGEVVELGSDSTECAGPDVTGLFTGSEGLFGIALEITLRLLPKVECYHTVLASYPSTEAAGDAVAAVVASGLLPGAMEIMDRLAMDAAEAAVGAGYPPAAAAMLIVELEGPRDQVALEREKLQQLIVDSGAQTIHVARNDDERLKIWKGRKCAFSAVGRLSPDFIVQDGVVPRRRLGEALRGIAEIAARHSLRIANVFHAGDGNLHPLIMYDGREAGAYERAEEAAAEILRLCTRMGGSITGEHGVGMEKRAFLADMFGPADIAMMHRIRHAFDPEEIANPGKMFPAAEAPALTHHGLHPLEKAGVAFRE
ncbi:MAG TPA: FAD-linked oxidase C-terminal domain-containing protein [Verrucomicrobiales bacterium]|nr:FAD-linked oxidase C-terminal domain-containing protein [Verrucomicrobiales bacterium]